MISGLALVAILIFVAGTIGFLTRRNIILMILFAELMLQGVSLNLINASAQHADYGGQILAIMVITVAACEAALALVLILALYQRKATLDISRWSQLGEEPLPEKDKQTTPSSQNQSEGTSRLSLIP
ncbi:MAG: NADH-quinone oxidoreductase subunit NuoK [Gemmatales bacterium]|nr:NADH-quinone oxidoreductase subunit NuoK [Gemmatales bacterium]MDW7993386.1 NADH-quinone oxidoreductase subunit NuoK [Gemmatales bacterium]